jgi:hypothetical protein
MLARSRSRHWLMLAGLFGGVAAPATALACGATPDAVWAFASTVPADGATAIPIDGAIGFEGRPFTDIYKDERHGNELAAMMTVRVRDVATRHEVAGRVEGWSGGKQPSAVWRPETPLAPHTSYEVDARIDNRAGTLPEAVTGPQVVHVTFTTGDGRAVPLALAGAPVIAREEYDQPIYPCGYGICGQPPNCAPAGSLRRARLRAEVGGASGGSAPYGYSIVAYLVAGKPGDPGFEDDRIRARATGQAWAIAPAGTPSTLRFDVPSDLPGRYCVYVIVRDASNLTLEPEPTCLDWNPAPAAPAPAPAMMPGRGDQAELASGGCAMGGGGQGGGTAIVVLVLLGLLRLRRSRRA